ncbi:MAG: PQQ-binding-like beta-propeller repeat protein [Verrucomicrobia bacterium]|nr:PQQ-binding-like beta-propeller repeat protein [Verrucomicrobiota bacterium]
MALFLASCSQSPHISWSVKTGERVHSSATEFPDGTIVIGSDDFHLYAISPDGAVLWKKNIGSEIRSTPAVSKDALYFGSMDGFLYCMSFSGDVIWRADLESPIPGSPCILPNSNVVVAPQNGKVLCVTPDGQRRWTRDLGATVESSASANKSSLVFTTGGKSPGVVCLSHSGEQKWFFPTSGPIVSSPAFDHLDRILIGCLDHHLLCLNLQGKLVWTFKTDDEIHSSPVIDAEGNIYFGSLDTRFYKLNPEGKEQWSNFVGTPIRSSAALNSRGDIIVGAGNGDLLAFSRDGLILWKVHAEWEIHSSPLITSQGLVVVGSGDFRIYALQSGGLPRDGIWSQFRGGRTRTGLASN